ncbi:MAG: SDR family NAD(P)-dependent oxidoreductase [Oscillospiraceae bacterium]|nr:SDR family NAD(P)-dependent oxidoreductase [Oscillospiraceae bacterium]
MAPKIVSLVTGGSSGIGKAAALALSKAGCAVFEVSRSGSDFDNIRHINGDVTDPIAMKCAVETVVKAEGRLDILVCCAGFGISGAAEFTEHSAAARQLDVNYMGVVNAVTAALPIMRAQGSGRIVAVSSVAGEIAIPFQAHYSASKAAIIAYVNALRGEVRPFGITLTSVLPGDTRTGFTSARKKSSAGDEIYSGRITRSVSRMERDEQNGVSPDKVGSVIAKAALKRRVPPEIGVGADYKLFLLLNRILPRSLVSRLIYKIYG